MSERLPGPNADAGVADAVIEERSRPSIVWLIPLIALLVGAFVAYRAFSERGPVVTIVFKSAEGLEAGKTLVKYKDVTVGVVEAVTLNDDLSNVEVRARMVKDAGRFLTEKTRFWVVKPRIAGGEVSGLGTLLSGSYIGVDPVIEGSRTSNFIGLDVAPIVSAQEPGRQFTLRSTRAGAMDVGAPVYFRRIEVGKVVSSKLDADDAVTTEVFIRSPYETRVHSNSRFWNASGFDVSVSAAGLKIDTESLVSILIGGIAFDSPHAGETDVPAEDIVFTLYETREDADKRQYSVTVPYRLDFNQSVRGLTIGSPVEFRGIPVGRVTDLKLELDRTTEEFHIPVMIEIEPERFTNVDVGVEERRHVLDALVAKGLRAQLKTGNLLTGQLVISLDFHKNVPPATIDWTGGIAQLPTIPTPIEEITANLTKLVERLGKVPIDQIGIDLQKSLAALQVTLKGAEGLPAALERTLATTDRTLASLGPDSSVNSELRRALLELTDAARALGLAADQIQTQPNSLIFGKEGNK